MQKKLLNVYQDILWTLSALCNNLLDILKLVDAWYAVDCTDLLRSLSNHNISNAKENNAIDLMWLNCPVRFLVVQKVQKEKRKQITRRAHLRSS